MNMKRFVLNLLTFTMICTFVLVVPTPKASAYATYENFRVLVRADNSATIIGYIDSKATDVEIPEELSGHTVKAIDYDADTNDVIGFSECTKLQTLYIPKTVESIAPGSFSGTSLVKVTVDPENEYYSSDDSGALYDKEQTKLIQYPMGSPTTEYTIPTKVKIIDSYAFSGAKNLTTVHLSALMETIESYAFYNCPKLSTVDAPKSSALKHINDSAFEICKNLTSFEIPNTVQDINKSVFKNCTSLEVIELPTALKILGDGAFLGCTKLKGKMYLNSNTAETSSVEIDNDSDATLLANSATVLPTYQFEIPDGTETLGTDVFNGCTAMTKVVVPESIKKIPERAFYKCTSLATADLPAALEYVDTDAFNGCTKLTSFKIESAGKEIGKRAFYGCTSLEIANLHNSDDMANGITDIDEYAFYGCTKLDSIIVPLTVKKIGEFAFSGCKGLISADIPGAVDYIGPNTFADCTSLENITLSTDIGYIGEKAFSGCSSLPAIEIPTRITSIEPQTFYGCKVLKNVTIPSNVETIGEEAFVGCTSLSDLTISDNVKSIDSKAFSGCTGITSITLGSGLETIAANAFEKATSKNNPLDLVIPESVKSIGESAFANTPGIKSVNIKANVNTIEASTFEKSTALASVTFPSTLREIKTKAFSGCTALAEINFNDGLETIADNAFASATSSKVKFDLVIPESVTSIGNSAFSKTAGLDNVTINAHITVINPNTFQNSGLTSVTMPDTLKTIDTNAFNKCTSLAEINFNDGLQSIEANAFDGATGKSSVVDITVPESVTFIGDSAFANTAGLENVTLNAHITRLNDSAFKSSALKSIIMPDTLKTIGTSAFVSCANLQSVDFPESVETIEASAFNKSGLKTLVLPDTIKEIGDSSFASCASLTDVTTSAGLTAIGTSAFEKCTALTNLTIKQGPAVINKSAFSGCKMLPSVTIPEGILQIGESAFASCTALSSADLPSTLNEIGKSAFASSGLKSIVIPDGVEILRSSAFSTCKSLGTAVVPASVTTFEDKVFSGCESLTDLTLKDGLTVIGESAFASCKLLKEIDIPASVTTIGAKAFNGCTLLDNATFGGDAPKKFATGIFDKTASGFVIYALAGTDGFTQPTWNGYSCLIISIANFDITPPDKVEYLEGEEFDPTGLKVVVTYSNGVSQEISSAAYKLDGYDSTPGIKKMIIEYLGQWATFEVTVINPEIDSIELVPPTKKTYSQDDKVIDTTGMVLTAHYSNGYTETVSSDNYRITGFDPTNTGEQTITVSHSGFSKTFEIWVISNALTKIEITSAPLKVAYIEGEDFDTTGLTVTAVYGKGSSEKREQTVNYEIKGYDTSSVGIQSVIVTFADAYASFGITVSPKELQYIEVTPPDKLMYYEGEQFDSTGMVCTAYFNNGKSAVVRPDEVMGYDSSTGTKTITVKYKYDGVEKVDTFDVVVTVDRSLSSLVCDMEFTTTPYIVDTKMNAKVKINNKLTENLDATLIVAAYYSFTNEMVGRIIITPITLKPGINDNIDIYTYVGTDVDIKNCYFKVFLWDGLHLSDDDIIVPYAKALKS